MNGRNGRGHGAKLLRRQESAIAALLSQPSIRKAAEKAGVSDRRLRAWLKEDAQFQEAYRDARQKMLEHALSRLQATTGAAVTVLRRLLRTSDEKVALSSALGVIDRATRGAEMLDVLTRIEALERRREVKR
jgi:hypothetical protein